MPYTDSSPHFYMRIGFLLSLILLIAVGSISAQEEARRFVFADAPPLPEERTGFFLGSQDDILIAAGGMDSSEELRREIYVLTESAAEWRLAGELAAPLAGRATASTAGGVYLVSGHDVSGASDEVWLLVYEDDRVTADEVTRLPEPLRDATATGHQDLLYVAGRSMNGATLVFVFDRDDPDAGWHAVPDPPVEVGERPVFASSQDRVYLLGPEGSASYLPRDGWMELPAAPWWPLDPTSAPFGVAHIFVPGAGPDGESGMLLYHTHTGTWVETAEAPWEYESPRAVRRSGEVMIFDRDNGTAVEVISGRTGFGILDSLMIGVYLCGMVAMGFYFIRRRRNAADYFRGGNRIPWWAAGMSLFATGASAISLMSMPWKGYSENLTYLGISLYAVMALPLAVFILAPLVRHLAIVTPGHYMERRFGLGARMLAAGIFCFTQIGARMGAILLLPSIAISAVTGIPIEWCIVVMGAVTTIYTYIGGLGAVVWTDTVQGFVMVTAVVGCLVLALMRLDTPPGDAWAALQAFERMVVFDFRWDLTYPTAYLLFITTVVGTLMGISDQNFVQRVQSTPSLRETKLAVATQLAVAVPINILLFSLGLVLFLFYRERPDQLDPGMATDGIFPFFVAQELPVGVSGLVIAALMAATMSTISSSICATANVATEDFFRRFKPNMTERDTVILGRFLTAIVGIAGTGTAFYLSKVDVGSIWDLAQMVINVIGNGVVGFFALGLLTRRAHQWGSMLGVVCGFAVIIYMRNYTDISFWAYSFVGTVVTFVTGYLFSILIPAKEKDTSGLTVFSLREARPESAEAAQHVGLNPND